MSKVSFRDQFQGEPVIMGIVNVTPDSFSDGGNFYNQDKAIEHGLQLISEGASILDVGGETTKPGSEPVDIKEEIDRVVPVIEALKDKAPFISIDTRNAATMEAALASGASIINDISALEYDAKSVHVVSEAKVPIVLMHAQGSPVDMQKNPQYNNVLDDIFEYLKQRIEFCRTHRIDDDLLLVDPGIGFGKTLEHNLLIQRDIKVFHDLGTPVLLGASRKSFIAAASEGEAASDRLGGSIASVLWGLSQGVQVFRVHDVKETKQAIDIFQAICTAGDDG